MTTKGSNNPFPSVLFTEGDPEALASNPAVGQRRLAVGTDHLLYLVDDTGVATAVGGGVTDHGALTGLSDDDHTQYVLRSILTTNGDLFTRSAGAVARLGIGSSGDVLTVSGGAPTWAAPAGGSGLTQAYVGYNTVGGTSEDAVAFRHICKSVTLSNDCLITGIETYLQMDVGPDTFGLQVGVWANNSGAVGKLLALSAPYGAGSAGSTGAYADIAATDPRWFNVPIGYWATAATYWIGIMTFACGFNANRLNVYYDGSGSDRRFDSGAGYAADGGAFTQTDTTRKYSIRANTIR